MSSAAQSQGKQKLCAYCDRTFTKVEHLKRHQRSRELHGRYRYNRKAKIPRKTNRIYRYWRKAIQMQQMRKEVRQKVRLEHVVASLMLRPTNLAYIAMFLHDTFKNTRWRQMIKTQFRCLGTLSPRMGLLVLTETSREEAGKSLHRAKRMFRPCLLSLAVFGSRIPPYKTMKVLRL